LIGNSVNVWQIACASNTLGSAPQAIERSGRRIALFRDSHGVAHALEDRCAHRQVPLSAGRVQGDNLECPYHGWQYACEGEVAWVPALGCARRDIRIASFATVESDGFIWVASLPDQAMPLQPQLFPNKNASQWHSFILQNTFAATVESCLENFLDCPHATFVHRYWFRAPTNAKVKTKVTTSKEGLCAELFEEPRKKSLVWALLSPKNGAMQHTDRFLSPARSQVDYIFPNGWQYTISSSCSEVNDSTTEVFTVISFKIGAFSNLLGPLIRLYFEPLSKRIIGQDIAMLAMQSENLRRHNTGSVQSTAIANVSTQADLIGAAIVRWRKDLLNTNSALSNVNIDVKNTVREVDIYL
jgi:phenylpropionate dioxygenase-like ring-hydroxylating dioxygenase large terminal subunit